LIVRTKVAPFDENAIEDAARLIRAGVPVAVPTETVYGLAADATSAAAVSAIYAAKGRPSFNPLIVHVAGLEDAEKLGAFNDIARALAIQHWPGALTIVVPLRTTATVASTTTAGLSTIALRVPDHRVMQALLRATGLPLAAPSANASGMISPTRAEHVLRTLDGKIPMIIDDGPTLGGIESTIVKVEGETIYLLRPGPVDVANAIPLNAGTTIESPGQMAAHYAPSKPLRLDATSSAANEWHLGFADVEGDLSLSRSGDLREAASRLFDLLHAADQSRAKRIAVAPIPNTGVGLAINDRLRRAAAGAP
jgi:L-threonylcarbamoyladenylate synthase